MAGTVTRLGVTWPYAREVVISVWRDNNRDSKPDYHGPEDKGWYGINIHKHRGSDARVNTGGASAGCQVFQSSKDFAEFMETCDEARDKWETVLHTPYWRKMSLLNEGL